MPSGYTALPYVRSGRLADLILQRGRDEAEAARRQGELSARMWANLGNTIANTVTSVAKQREEAPRLASEQQLRNLQIQEAQGQVAAQQRSASDTRAMDTALGSTLDPAAIEQALAEGGFGHLVPSFRKSWNDAETAKANLAKAKTQAADAENDYLGALAAGVRPFLDGPDKGFGALTMALQHAKDIYPDADQLLQQLQQNPDALPQLVDSLIAKSPAQQKLLGEQADRTLRQKQEERAIEQMHMTQADREADNRRQQQTLEETQRHNKVMEANGSQSAYQAKEVLGDDGKAVMATFDPRSRLWQDPSGKTIRNPRPVPSAMEQMDSRKFEKAGPVLKSIESLSERINTSAGLIAKMRGGAEKVKAQANYNDDVAEYQALISGFTPLVARSLGHIGVLTQQDVDSVKELFPKPGDSKTLRDRKILRIQSILGDLEAVEGRTATPPTPTPGRVYYDANGNRVQR